MTLLFVSLFFFFLFVFQSRLFYLFNKQGCQFSDFSLISDFLRIKESGIELIKYSQNISTVSKDRLNNGKGLDNPSLNTVSSRSDYLQTKFRLSQ